MDCGGGSLSTVRQVVKSDGAPLTDSMFVPPSSDFGRGYECASTTLLLETLTQHAAWGRLFVPETS